MPIVRLKLCGVLLTLGFYGSLFAAETNTVEAIRLALQSAPKVWGEVKVGKATLSQADPRAAAIGQQFSQILRARGAQPNASAIAPGPAAVTQHHAITLLRDRAGADVEVHLRPGNQTVMQIRGGSRALERAAEGIAKAGEGERSERTARNFLRANRVVLRLEEPDEELRLESRQREGTGRQHLKFAQVFNGVPVWPAGLGVHLDSGDNVMLVDGAYVPTPSGLATQPLITADEAVSQAKSSVENGQQGEAREISLIIYGPLNQTARLAWKFRFSVDIMHAWIVIVDALDGRVLNLINQCFDVGVGGSANDLGGLSRNVNIWSADGKFYMADTTKSMYKPAFDAIKDPHGVITIFDARELPTKELKTVYVVESTSATTWLPDAISAMFNFGHTFDYFFGRLNRNSLDGNGGNVQAVVRVGQMDNAFWSGDLKMMFFGNVRPYPSALDVVGHELAHGVTQNSADLIYELQPGAMNESFSDIFGEMVEALVEGKNDWIMGTKLGKAFRNMKNPGLLQIEGLNRAYPSKMSEFVDLPNSNDGDHGGVHINSSILNHAFYLLAEGLDGAVGLRDAEQIFYRCLTQHMQKQSQFIDARLGCIAAAEALFGAGSVQSKKVAEAFDAVEIFAKPATPDPTPIPAVQGPDSTLFISIDPLFAEIALGRREAAFNDPIDGIALAESVKPARPSVSGDGQYAVFVDSENDVCVVNTDNPNSLQCLGFAGLVHSVALSPDAQQVAFVLLDPLTGQPDNRITVYHLINDTSRTFELLVPVVDGTPVDSVLYADAMVFTSDGKQLIYDAVSELKFGGGSEIERWSIFRINLPTETTTVLVPPLVSVDFGNPNIGRAGNRYLTFDARDPQSGVTTIINMDLFTGDVAEVASVGQGFGFPGFTGDESAIVYAAPDAGGVNTGFSLFKQSLTANRLGKNGQPTLWLPDATVGVIYRRGTFVSSNPLPTVLLTAPADNVSFAAPATITISANAADSSGGTVAKVEFYEGGNKLGEDGNAPYAFTWSNVGPGTYRLGARAIDNVGGSSDSQAVTVTVGPSATSPIKLSAVQLPGNVLRITVRATPGNYTIQQSKDLSSWVDLNPVAVGATGAGSVDDAAGPANNSRLYYRARKN